MVALALGGFVYSLNQQRQADFAAQTAEARQNELLSAPDAKIYTATRDGAQYSFVVSKQRNAALFIGTDLANPGADKAYQLWTLQGRKAFPDALVAASAGTQWFDRTDHRVDLPGDLDRARRRRAAADAADSGPGHDLIRLDVHCPGHRSPSSRTLTSPDAPSREGASGDRGCAICGYGEASTSAARFVLLDSDALARTQSGHRLGDELIM